MVSTPRFNSTAQAASITRQLRIPTPESRTIRSTSTCYQHNGSKSPAVFCGANALVHFPASSLYSVYDRRHNCFLALESTVCLGCAGMGSFNTKRNWHQYQFVPFSQISNSSFWCTITNTMCLHSVPDQYFPTRSCRLLPRFLQSACVDALVGKI